MDGESTQTRERWLLRGVEALRPVFAAHAITLPAVAGVPTCGCGGGMSLA